MMANYFVLQKTAFEILLKEKPVCPFANQISKFRLVKNKGLTQGIRTQIPPYFPFQCMLFPSNPNF